VLRPCPVGEDTVYFKTSQPFRQDGFVFHCAGVVRDPGENPAKVDYFLVVKRDSGKQVVSIPFGGPAEDIRDALMDAGLSQEGMFCVAERFGIPETGLVANQMHTPSH
jgi:hypothetical protein